jgi:hypothetical protein
MEGSSMILAACNVKPVGFVKSDRFSCPKTSYFAKIMEEPNVIAPSV